MQSDLPIPSPPWLAEAKKDLGWHEIADNRGISYFIKDAHAGNERDPWCAIAACAWLERAGIRSPRSASSQAFVHHPDFVRISKPALGAIVVYWRQSPHSGLGHVGFYLGETKTQILTRGGNESDAVRDQFESARQLVGYYWPRAVALPTNWGPIPVAMKDGHPVGSNV